MESYYKLCKEHDLEARYCIEERRWICPKCKPEIMGLFIEINGIKIIWGEIKEENKLFQNIP